MSIAEKLTTIAENEQKVFDAGVKNGRDAEWGEFWDAYQKNGTQKAWNYAFYGPYWNDITFKPKYDITFTPNQNVYTETFRGAYITDLKKILEDQKVVLDTSGCSGSNGIALFYQCTKLTRVPTLDMSNLPNGVATIFYNCQSLQYVEKMILSDNGTTFSDNAFNNCKALEEIRFEGKIGSDIDMHWSPLSHDSLMSTINALKDYSGTSGTHTLTIGTDNLAKLTDSEKAIATQKGWTLA